LVLILLQRIHSRMISSAVNICTVGYTFMRSCDNWGKIV